MPITFSSSDLDGPASESGVVHESTTNTDYTNSSELQQGYPVQSPLFPTNLYLYAPLHEDSGSTAYDFSGNNRDGTYNGAGPADSGTTTGILGATAPLHDGGDDNTDFGDLAIPAQITLSFWVYWESVSTSSTEYVVDFGLNSSNDQGIAVQSNSGAVSSTGGDIVIYIGGSGIDTAYTPTTGTWQYYVVSYDSGGNLVFDVNGTQVHSTTTGDGSLADSSRPLRIGEASFGGSNGHLRANHLRIDSVALADSKKQALYDVAASSGSLITQGKTS